MDKQTAIKQVEDGQAELNATIDGLDEAAMTKTFYGDWSVKEILAHIAGWQTEMTGGIERMARGERPTPEGVDYGDADAWNAKFAAAVKSQSASDVAEQARAAYTKFIAAAQSIGDDRFGEGKTINRMLAGTGSEHYAEHLPALRDYRKQLGE